MQVNNLPETFSLNKTHIEFWLIDKYSKRKLTIGWGNAHNIPRIHVPIDLLITITRAGKVSVIEAWYLLPETWIEEAEISEN
jgi:hypothetical protein